MAGLTLNAPAFPDEARYRQLVDAITDYAIYMLDADGLIASWNSGAQRFKGYRANEVLGRHFSIFYTEEERAEGRPARALRIAAEQGRFETEGWRLRKDGTRFWAGVVIDPIRDEHGVLVGYAKVTRDLSERKEAAEALRRSEEQFRLLVQGVTDYALYMLDRDGRVVSWNVGAERIKGYRPEEVIGRHFSAFHTDEDREAGLPQRSLAIAAQVGRFESEGWRVRKDGGRFWAHVVVDAIRNDAGEVIGFAKITRDITERRATQQALEEAQQALFQSQKLESIGQLTGGIAHDFNNLLMAILGSLELLRKRLPEDPRLRGLVDTAVMGAERGAALTQRMLAFARRQDMRRTAVEVAPLVDGLTGLLQPTLGPGVRIRAEIPANLPPASTDRNQLETALVNLVVNARDAMPDGGEIVITAVAQRLAKASEDGLPAGDYVRLQVSDSGAGMDDLTLARATEPFFTTKGVGKGTGLGLSMVHGMAEQSGGKLRLASARGKGTTVQLWLPASTHAALEALSEVRPSPAREVGRLRILAVDDDVLVLMNTAAMLEDLGHEVLTADSGAEALDLLAQSGPVDLVITDQAMPGMTGVQLVDAIRRRWPAIPVVLATGYAEGPEVAGPQALRLAKPFMQADLARAVEGVMRPAA